MSLLSRGGVEPWSVSTSPYSRGLIRSQRNLDKSEKDWRFPGDRLITRRISPFAVCCSRIGQRSPEAFDLGLRVIRVGPRDSASSVERAGAFRAELRPLGILMLASETVHTERLPFQIVSGQPGTASRHPGSHRRSASRPFRGARAPRPYPDPASGARWAVLGRGSPWSCGETPSAAPTGQNSRLRHAPDGYTPSWRPDPDPLEAPAEPGQGGLVEVARRPLLGGGPAGSGESPAAPTSVESPRTRTRSRPPGYRAASR